MCVALGDPAAVELLYALMPSHGAGAMRPTSVACSPAWRCGPLDLESVIAYRALPENVRSRQVLEKCGFSEEGEVVHEELPHVLFRRRRG